MKDINQLIQQFESMQLMHRVLRYRIENGMSIPKNEENAKIVMQQDLKNVLSAREMKEMQRARMKLRKKR